MRFLKSLFGSGERGGTTVKARLRLESLDGRIVPDATPVTPPGSGAVVTPPEQSELTLDTDVTFWLQGDGDQWSALKMDEYGNVWLFSNGEEPGQVNADLLIAGANFDPMPDVSGMLAGPDGAHNRNGQDLTKPTAVFFPSGNVKYYPPGMPTYGPAGSQYYFDQVSGHNIVVAPGMNPPQPQPIVVRPQGQAPGGIQYNITSPGGITVIAPGNSGPIQIIVNPPAAQQQPGNKPPTIPGSQGQGAQPSVAPPPPINWTPVAPRVFEERSR